MKPSPMHAHARHALRPVVGILLGASLWGVIWYPMRLLQGGGLSGLWLTLILYATALVVSLPFTWQSLAEFRERPGLLPGLMLLAGWTNIAFIEAVLTGNILRVLLLFYLSPFWAVLLGRLVLREVVSRTALWSLAVAMAGALTMLWNPQLGAPWPQSTADWLALSSGFAFALSNVVVRKMENVSVEIKATAVWAGVVLLAVILIPVSGAPALNVRHEVFAGAVALGLFGIVLMTTLVQYGVSHLPVHRSAVLALIELVAGAVSQQLLTDEVVTLREWTGGALIVAGAWMSARASVREGDPA